MSINQLGQLICPKCQQVMYRDKNKDTKTVCGTIAAFTCDGCNQTDTVFAFPTKIVGDNGGEGFIA